MLLELDLDESPSLLYIRIMSNYDAKYLNTDYSKMDITQFPFTIASAIEGEYSFIGSLRSHWLKKYSALDINRHYGIGWIEWIKQPAYIIQHQLANIVDIVKEKADIISSRGEDDGDDMGRR